MFDARERCKPFRFSELREHHEALSDRGESAVEFDDRFRRLRERHAKKRNLMGLLKKAGLLS